jgi:hypothetical protein
MWYARPAFLTALVVAALGLGPAAAQPTDGPLLTPLPSDETGITFSNDLDEGPDVNVLSYEYLYNGGGVAAGDLNGDGRPDLYFTSNQNANALYLNEGDFQFREVTAAAGVADRDGWTTGVTMADVNGDGRLDIYVCRSGWMEDPDARRNKLYIHQGTGADGVPRFEERAAAYGLDDPAQSTHATFFDYDRDGDLDLYLLNHPVRRYMGRSELDAARDADDPMAGDKLYRNDGGSGGSGSPTFVEVTAEAGITSSALGYGLSATVSDINRDGWPDLYVANDYMADDYLYINQGDGTFEESLRDWMDHTSYSSMGSDIADVTNDGRPDVFTLDMLAEGQRRQKLLKGPEDFRFYRDLRSRGYYFQYMRNMLHRHNGNGTFSEVGQLAGVSNTDWSWAALLVDFDLDGRKDLYVTNGYRRDYTNLDFLNGVLFSSIDYLKYSNAEDPASVDVDLYGMTRKMPSTPIPNYLFRNAGPLRFEDMTEAWNAGQRGFSTGAAYADLNNDGAPDLVVNNINQEAFVYRNEARARTDNNYLSVELAGTGDNRFGIGAKVELTTPDGRTFYQEQVPARGFQSSVEPALHFGVGAADSVSLAVTWPDQTRERRPGVAVNQTVTLRQADARPDVEPPSASTPPPLLTSAASDRGLSFTHRENEFIDYRAQPLLPHMLSREGPALASADVTGNGREDLFVGGARGQAAALFLQRSDGTFEEASPDVFASHRSREDTDAVFFDADGDGDQDLYVVSGGKAGRGGADYQDRLYLNDGTGGFTHAPDALPTIESSGGTVAAHDFNGDGRTDLFVGGRVWPGEYPLPPRSHLLENTGGRFEDVTTDIAPLLFKPGMVTDALWSDLDGDDTTELVLAGEWMPIRVFEYGSVLFEEETADLGFSGTNGWWYSLAAADLTGDGTPELVAGNRGLNAQVQATPGAPAAVYAADFARDGAPDALMTHHLDGEEYPVYWHDDLVEAIPPFENRFSSYEDYATSTIDEILTDREQDAATRLTATTFETSVFHDEGGTFRRRALPREAQLAPIHGLVVHDLNGDDRPDLLLAGNDFTVRPQWGRADAEKGTVLLNEGDLRFDVRQSRESGFFAPKDVRSMTLVGGPSPLVVVGNNDAPLSAFSPVSPPQ